MIRSPLQNWIDFLTFPFRAIFLHGDNRFGLSCLATDRFDFVARNSKGRVLDVGCGPWNRFVSRFWDGNGVGIDVFPYEGLDSTNLIDDPTQFPFADEEFDTVTFIANINHIPRSQRDLELAEALRCLKPGGRIVVTMGNPLAEILVHRLLAFSDRFLGTSVDHDTERGMDEEESYYLLDSEIHGRLVKAGFTGLKKKYIWTEWWLNHLFVAFKPESNLRIR